MRSWPLTTSLAGHFPSSWVHCCCLNAWPVRWDDRTVPVCMVHIYHHLNSPMVRCRIKTINLMKYLMELLLSLCFTISLIAWTLLNNMPTTYINKYHIIYNMIIYYMLDWVQIAKHSALVDAEQLWSRLHSSTLLDWNSYSKPWAVEARWSPWLDSSSEAHAWDAIPWAIQLNIPLWGRLGPTKPW